MSLLPYSNRTTEVVPFGGVLDPFYNMTTDPLSLRSMSNARGITRPLQPILYSDVLDMGDKYEVFTDLPGVMKEDLDVSINDGAITIKGERRKRFESDDIWNSTHRIERSYGKCSRTMQLPLDCDTDNPECSFEHGELKVIFNKKLGTSLGSKHLLIK